MAQCFLHGNGGANPLNFKVVGNPQPTNPRENTIWVNTSTAITDWVFSGTQPTTPTNGMVWIFTGLLSSVPFDALKKNSIELLPQNAKQYVSGVWVDKAVKTYQGGKWIDWWNGELYEAGNEYELVTGGWQAYARKYDGGTAIAPTVRRDATSIYVAMNGGGGGTFHTANKIDITGFSTLFFDGYASPQDNSPWVTLGLWRTTDGDWQPNLVAQLRTPVSGSKCTLDLTNVADGEYYIGFGLYNNGTYMTLKSLKLLR